VRDTVTRDEAATDLAKAVRARVFLHLGMNTTQMSFAPGRGWRKRFNRSTTRCESPNPSSSTRVAGAVSRADRGAPVYAEQRQESPNRRWDVPLSCLSPRPRPIASRTGENLVSRPFEARVDMKNSRVTVLLLCAFAMLSACAERTAMSSLPETSTSVVAARTPDQDPGKYIKHVIIIVQENRTLDNLFSGFPGANAPTYGYSGSQKITLQPVSLSESFYLDNNWSSAITAWDSGKMDGFAKEPFYGSASATTPYSYVQRSQIQTYWNMAQQYVLADHMFPTEFGSSLTAHIDLISGNTQLVPGKSAEVNYPSDLLGCNAPAGTWTYLVNASRAVSSNGPFPCYTQFRTLADTLDAANVSWRYYAPSISSDLPSRLWSPFMDIKAVYFGPDWAKVISPETTVLTDIADGSLPNVAWVIPDWQNSDHPGNGSDTGPSWVASVVNAVGKSKYWSSSAIFVLWDDWGGWYDNVPPPQLDYLGLAIRVPCIVISPYAPMAQVDHTTYEFGSILKFVENTFGLPTLGSVAEGYTDARATGIGTALDFSQKPRTFTVIEAKYPASRFLHEKPSLRPPDDD
jgi:phospholipase C